MTTTYTTIFDRYAAAARDVLARGEIRGVPATMAERVAAAKDFRDLVLPEFARVLDRLMFDIIDAADDHIGALSARDRRDNQHIVTAGLEAREVAYPFDQFIEAAEYGPDPDRLREDRDEMRRVEREAAE